MPFFIAPDGVRLHYKVEGSGPPLLLHLGAGADADLWRAAGYVEPLSRSYTCVLFDHRGHGQSDHPRTAEANHIDRYVGDVVALAEHLGDSKVSFFGWSSAVAVGLKAADEHPDVFDALVLFGAIARRAAAEQIADATKQRLAALREKGWHYILDPMVAAERSPVPQWFLDRVVATDIEPLIAYSAARPAWNWSPWDAAPRVELPTLILAGELEDPDDVMGELASLMPSATRVRIPDREHINAFLASDLVVPLLMDFLATWRGTPAR
jgi:pimeloyl-ACP methyl ester carboxylesterase